MPRNTYSSDNQPDIEDKPKRGKGKRSLMLDAIRAQVIGGEEAFLKKVIDIGLGDEETPPNPQLLNLVINRIEPPLKATMPLIEFEFDPNSKPHEQASQVMNAVADGIMSPDTGSMFVSSIKSMLDIEEHTELKARIERLEEMLNNG